MILGLGTDIVDIRRVERLIRKFGNRFLKRVFTQDEIAAARHYKNSNDEKYYAHFAKRFAAKEAAAKALGVGIGRAVSFTDISITNLPSGQPILEISGKGARRLAGLAPENTTPAIHISLSDEYPIAYATVIISD